MNITLLLSTLLVALSFLACLFGFFGKKVASQPQRPASASKSPSLFFICPGGDYSTPAPKYLPRSPLICPKCGRRLFAR